jgi:hypothetical protein
MFSCATLEKGHLEYIVAFHVDTQQQQNFMNLYIAKTNTVCNIDKNPKK